jgi:uncharacterized protein involved in cysteine biosynthesis
MLRALILSLRQLGDPAIVRVLAKSLLLTAAVFAALGVGLYYALSASIPALTGWQDDGVTAAVATVVIAVLAAWLLFRVVAIAVLGLFGDDIVHAVEARHYPVALASARPAGMLRAARLGLGSAARALALNLLMVPVYLALLFTAIGPAIAFFAVNAWLLGRDLGDMVASRHLDDAAMRGWRKATAGRRWLLGLAVTGLFVVPLLNILAPILGAAMATHLFHGDQA